MKKYMVLSVIVFCLILSQLAFAGPKFGVGGNLGFPMGDWSDLTGSVAFGGTAQALFPMGENMAVGVQAGYMIFGGETIEAFGTKIEWDFTAIPILAVGRYYLGVPGGPRPFVGALVGFHLFSVDAKGSTTVLGQTFSSDASTSSTDFSFGPSAGIEIGAIEISGYYMLISEANYVGARIGFNFGGTE